MHGYKKYQYGDKMHKNLSAIATNYCALLTTKGERSQKTDESFTLPCLISLSTNTIHFPPNLLKIV